MTALKERYGPDTEEFGVYVGEDRPTDGMLFVFRGEIERNHPGGTWHVEPSVITAPNLPEWRGITHYGMYGVYAYDHSLPPIPSDEWIDRLLKESV